MIEGIRDRFNELHVGFVRKGKHENRNELEFILDEMLRQGDIDPTEYKTLNIRLTEVEDLMTDKEKKEEEEVKKKKIWRMLRSSIWYYNIKNRWKI